MAKKITFILMKTKNSNTGKLYSMIYEGSKVYKRTSLKEDVLYKDWVKESNRVKKTNINAERINKIIEDETSLFQIGQLNIPDGDDNQCVLEYMKTNMDTGLLTKSSLKKYDTILKNFKEVIQRKFGMEILPFRQLRDIKFIKALKIEIQKDSRTEGKYKTNASWLSYMSVFRNYVSHWNKYSGTQFPINVFPLTSDIGKNPKKTVNTLSHNEIQKLTNYNPAGYGNGISQLLSKSIFLFQYHTGGIRIQDALLLTNKHVKENGIEIKIQKTERVELFPFNYEQVSCLKHYYPEEYYEANMKSTVGDLLLSHKTIEELNRIDGLTNLNDMNISDIEQILKQVIVKSKTNFEIRQFINPLEEVEERLKEDVTIRFFKLLKKRPVSFLLPKLNWDEFKSSYKNNYWEELTDNQSYIIHKAKAGHNSNLKRISNELGIEKMTGHTPRHTIANHLLNENVPLEEIQKVLVHSNPRTTMIYLNERHNSGEVSKVLNKTNKSFRRYRSNEEREI